MVELDRLYTEKETELRTRRTELKALAEQLGTADTGAIALKQKIALEAYADARSDLARLNAELQQAKDDLNVKQALVDAVNEAQEEAPDDAEPASPDVDDAILAQLADQIEAIDTRMETNRKTAKEPLLSKLSEQYVEERKSLVEKQEKRRKVLEARLQRTNPNTNLANLDSQTIQLKARINILAAKAQAAAKDLEDLRQKAERVGNSSIDLEMMRSESPVSRAGLRADCRRTRKTQSRAAVGPQDQRVSACRCPQESRWQAALPERGGGGRRWFLRRDLPGLVVGRSASSGSTPWPTFPAD